MFAGQFAEWLFLPGMLFRAREKWWTRGSVRSTVHEGLDFCYYRNRDNQICVLDQFARVPVLYPGIVTRIIDDFLGKSVFIGHHIFDKSGNRLYTLYGHILPDQHCTSGASLSDKSIVGAVGDASQKKSIIPSHLHISVAWIPQFLGQEELTWQSLRASGSIRLIDPLMIISPAYSLITTLWDKSFFMIPFNCFQQFLSRLWSRIQGSLYANDASVSIKFQETRAHSRSSDIMEISDIFNYRREYVRAVCPEKFYQRNLWRIRSWSTVRSYCSGL